MTSKRRNFSILALVLALLVLALGLIIPSSPIDKKTRLGLDLRGGVELIYEGQPTPQVPEVTPQAIDDAIETIRKRTDALGVSEPEIQRAGENQISIGLPEVQNAERAEEQVGTTAQLQFYDWEPNVIGPSGEPGTGDPNPQGRINGLYAAVQRAAKGEPKAEETDIAPGAGDDVTPEQADRENDTAPDRYYLFDPAHDLIAGPDTTCDDLLQELEEELPASGQPPAPREPKKGTECGSELRALGSVGPPKGSVVIEVPQGIVVVEDEESTQDLGPESPTFYYVLEDDSELSGSDIRNPEQNFDPNTQEPIVTMEFTDDGRRAFANVTQRIADRGASQIRAPGEPPENAFQRFAITLDNQIVSLATIDFLENPEGIDGRTGAQINGIGNLEDTQDLAENLRIGALPINLKLISRTQVSATLGQQALDEGLIAGFAGLALTLLFLLAFYRVLGVLAAVALVVYAILLFALIKLIPITLTLPGIAGVILTLGVAADANIVVFERVKEELRTGRSIPASVAAGYTKALKTIIDANVVTIGVAFILFMLATAGIKGFAFTLGVGTLTSLLTAVLFTSALMGSLSRTRVMRSRFALGVRSDRQGPRWQFDFMGRSKWFFSASGVILLIGALAISGKGIDFGIDFESGTRIKTPLEQPASTDDVRNALPNELSDAKIQEVDEPDLGETVFQISTQTLEPAEVSQLRATLDDEFGVSQEDFSANSIGPTFGEQIARTALIAVIASLILISIYITLRFEFKYSIPVLIALGHDILITGGVYAIADREVTTSTVAALLTIMGYSLYDTIIVFDRIRENVPRMPRAAFSQIVNRSMSEVLTRSLATSFSTLLPVTALMLFGGETLRDFAFALLVGIASGAYSSIFIASPVFAEWKEREPVYRRRRKVVMEENNGMVPAFATGAIADEEPAATTPATSRRRVRGRRPASSRPSGAGAATATAPAPPEPPEVAPPEPPPAVPPPAPPEVAAPKPPIAEGDGDGDGRTPPRPKPKKQRQRKKHGRR